MSDQTPDPSPAPEGDNPPVETTPEGAPATPPAEPKPEDELSPEAMRAELTRARNDAARYRTSLREAQAQLADAKTPEDIEAAVAEFKTRNEALEREVLVSRVARKFELPEKLAARLTGNTEEELEADAKSLQEFVVPVAPDPDRLSGGLIPDGDDDGEPNDPRALAQKYGRGRRSRA